MSIKSIRYLDQQGRIILPNHIRKALDLKGGSGVEVDLTDDGTIRVRVADERCSLCGESVEGKHYTETTIGTEKKRICYNCAQNIARAMMR